MTNIAIGVDIGGTRTKTGLVNLDTGQVLRMNMHPTEKNSEHRFLEQLGQAVKEHRQYASANGYQISGIGIGVPSFVHRNGVVDTTYGFLPFMEDYPLVSLVEENYQLRCRIDNDARAVALGESLFGGGKGFERVLVLTLGTGLGVGFVKNNRFEDPFPYSHMGGHMTIIESDIPCYCGKTGCLESLVAATGILALAHSVGFRSEPEKKLTVEYIFESLNHGNTIARSIVNQWLSYLKTGIDNYINIYAPDIIILGGGVSKALKNHLTFLNSGSFFRPYKNYTSNITISSLEEHAGILGSAALLKETAHP
ncbi:MAG: ROK family protein [Marivirga sp.]|nr:ROK family protein [Marivirga sp.]